MAVVVRDPNLRQARGFINQTAHAPNAGGGRIPSAGGSARGGGGRGSSGGNPLTAGLTPEQIQEAGPIVHTGYRGLDLLMGTPWKEAQLEYQGRLAQAQGMQKLQGHFDDLQQIYNQGGTPAQAIARLFAREGGGHTLADFYASGFVKNPKELMEMLTAGAQEGAQIFQDPRYPNTGFVKDNKGNIHPFNLPKDEPDSVVKLTQPVDPNDPSKGTMEVPFRRQRGSNTLEPMQIGPAGSGRQGAAPSPGGTQTTDQGDQVLGQPPAGSNVAQGPQGGPGMPAYSIKPGKPGKALTGQEEGQITALGDLMASLPGMRSNIEATGSLGTGIVNRMLGEHSPFFTPQSRAMESSVEQARSALGALKQGNGRLRLGYEDMMNTLPQFGQSEEMNRERMAQTELKAARMAASMRDELASSGKDTKAIDNVLQTYNINPAEVRMVEQARQKLSAQPGALSDTDVLNMYRRSFGPDGQLTMPRAEAMAVVRQMQTRNLWQALPQWQQAAGVKNLPDQNMIQRNFGDVLSKPLGPHEVPQASTATQAQQAAQQQQAIQQQQQREIIPGSTGAVTANRDGSLTDANTGKPVDMGGAYDRAYPNDPRQNTPQGRIMRGQSGGEQPGNEPMPPAMQQQQQQMAPSPQPPGRPAPLTPPTGAPLDPQQMPPQTLRRTENGQTVFDTPLE